MSKLAAALLLLGVIRHYGWELAPADIQPQVWNACAAIVISIFLLATASKDTWPVVAWWIAEEAQTFLCSIGWILNQWEVKPGEAQCSALLKFDLSTLGIFIVTLILICQATNLCRSQKKKESS